MSRISEIQAESRTPEQARLFQQVTGARGMFYSPYKVWIHSPPVGFGMEMIGTHLNSDSCALSAAEMEMAALITAQFWSATYVIKNHTAHAAKAGLDEETISALNSRTVPQLEDSRLEAVFRFTSSAVRGETPSDEEFEKYVSRLTRAGIAEILAVIGYFTSVSLAMKTHGIK
jgi:4-carboxymuconolactone decarboxylase